MNDMYVGQSPLERGHDEPEEEPLVTENNRLTDRIAELTAEVAAWKLYYVKHTAAIQRLTDLVKEAYEEGVSDTDVNEEGCWEESHARNALKEVV